MQPVHQDPYHREVMMARFGYLIRRKQQEVERITHINRGCFDCTAPPTPESGRIMRISLIGPYTQRSWYKDRRSLNFFNYELWVIVNKPLFTDSVCPEQPIFLATDVIAAQREG